jgi:hypothetical protein
MQLLNNPPAAIAIDKVTIAGEPSLACAAIHCFCAAASKLLNLIS